MASGIINAPMGLKTIVTAYPSGISNVSGAIYKYGHIIIVSKCVKISTDLARNDILISLPGINSEWEYLIVSQGNKTTPAHILGSDVILDAALSLSSGAYPIITGVGLVL